MSSENTNAAGDIANGKNGKNGKRGFAALPPERQLELARLGGKAAHKAGTAHEFTPEEAKAAGRKGGQTVSRDTGHMAAIGRLGGLKARQQRKASTEAP